MNSRSLAGKPERQMERRNQALRICMFTTQDFVMALAYTVWKAPSLRPRHFGDVPETVGEEEGK